MVWNWIEFYGFAVVVLWWALHTTGWLVVETYRLWRATLITLKRIKDDTEPGE